jgi:hypothetical protein
MNKQEIGKIADQLAKKGEDKDELLYWQEVYDNLPEDKQVLLYVNFKQELDLLNQN